ncbi:MAG: hypothetical protein CVU03_09715 [Bacteroidetes bacterium HGW-Bacteroidetes-2]|jgi:uncharacterized membrane protein|nr:MAG: hypothetical protein CVU03_09715 [Bacteroidetes bacterium HGW-Bacteroidetes-2]
MKLYIAFILTGFFFNVAFSQERILSYNSHIKVENSGSIIVREDITVQAEGDQIKRGIYRSFPNRYKDKLGTRFDVDFQVIEVLRDGKTEPYFTEKKGNGVVVYVGDKNIFLDTGIYTFSIVYRTTKQIGFFKEFDELYFNAIGGDWLFTIEMANITIELPQNATITQLDAFSGTQASTTCDCTLFSKDNKIKITTTRVLQPQEQLTFAVAWPKGFVVEPTSVQKIGSFFKSNFHVLFALLGFVLVSFLYYKAWKKVGVDPAKGTIIPLFEPPVGFSPADTAFLNRMYITQTAISAAIVNMAVKGHIKIINLKKKYTLERLSTNFSLLTEEEKAISNALFSGSEQMELDNKNYSKFSKARVNAATLLAKKMQPKYFNLNFGHLVKGILASVFFIVLTFVFSPSPVIPLILIFLLLFLVAFFTYLIKAPTKLGRQFMDEIEGFKMYITVAEQKQLDALHEPELTVERFEALLPYAIALGVENKWGEKFENALTKSLQETKSYSPSWYVGAGAMAFSPQQFSSSMGKNFSSAISSASTPPGSSSGSSGGGSSGGGGGGGGGGGW